MKTLNAKLADYFEVYGWDLICTHTQELEWWADEIWQLRSRWAPEGAEVFVTFLVDPMSEGNGRKRRGVWGVGCTASYPHTREHAEHKGVLRLNASKSEVEKFVELVNRFRTSRPDPQ